MKVNKILFKILKKEKKIFVMTSLFCFLHSMSSGMLIWITQNLNDRAIARHSERQLYSAIILLGIGVAVNHAMLGVHNYIFSVLSFKLEERLESNLHTIVNQFPLIYFEDSGMLDLIEKAKKGISGILVLFAVISTLVFFYIPYFLVVEVYLARAYPPLSFIVLAIFLPVFLTQVLKIGIYNKLENKAANERRRTAYFEKCLCGSEHFKETRVLHAQSFFMRLYHNSLKKLNEAVWLTEKKAGILELIMKCITLCGYVAVLFLLVYAVLQNKIGLGMFAAVLNYIGLMNIYMEEIICFHIGNLMENYGGIRNYCKLYEVGMEEQKEVMHYEDEIQLKGVFFHYPQSQKAALAGIDLIVKPEEMLAIVGENGSGKTTIAKVILGIFKPTDGAVYYGGNAVESERRDYVNASAMLQNFQKYKMSALHNIVLGQEALADTKKLIEDADRVGLPMEISEKFPAGVDTMLSKEFGGTDLSGGEWQKIALLRAMYRNSELLVLDEPTSAIDPLEESHLYHLFKEISKGKKSIVVTHRIGSAQIADRILVMSNGKIIEQGTHVELLQAKGCYYTMFMEQSRWY